MATPMKVCQPTQMPENWVKIGLPSKISTRKLNLQLMKRMVAIGVSQIAFLRFSNFPDDAFTPTNIGDLDLRLLKSKCSSEKAVAKISQILKSAMGALDKGYLRTLVMVIYRDQNKPDEILEKYTFTFSRTITLSPEGREVYVNDGCTLSSADGHNDSKFGGKGEKSIYKETKRLLRKLIQVTQNLEELPDMAFMTVRIGYYDDITPEGYEPPSFVALESCNMHFEGDENVVSIDLGNVSTTFQNVGLQVASIFAHDRQLSMGNSTRETVDEVEASMEQDNMNISMVPLAPGLDVTNNYDDKISKGDVVAQLGSMNIVERVNEKEKIRSASFNERDLSKPNKLADPMEIAEDGDHENLNLSQVSRCGSVRRRRSVTVADSFGREHNIAGNANSNTKCSKRAISIRI